MYPRSRKTYSGKLYPFEEIYSFKEYIFIQVQGHMFIQGNYCIFIEHCCVRGHSRNSAQEAIYFILSSTEIIKFTRKAKARGLNGLVSIIIIEDC